MAAFSCVLFLLVRNVSPFLYCDSVFLYCDSVLLVQNICLLFSAIMCSCLFINVKCKVYRQYEL